MRGMVPGVGVEREKPRLLIITLGVRFRTAATLTWPGASRRKATYLFSVAAAGDPHLRKKVLAAVFVEDQTRFFLDISSANRMDC